MIDILTSTFTAICLIGTVLNVKKNIWCFYLWIVGNICWLSFDVYSGLYSRSVLDLVQLCFAIWGVVEWKEKKNEKV